MAFEKKSHNFLSQLSSFAASTGMRRSSKASLLPTPNLIDLLTSRISSNKTLPSVSISMSLSKTPPTAKTKTSKTTNIAVSSLYLYAHFKDNANVSWSQESCFFPPGRANLPTGQRWPTTSHGAPLLRYPEVDHEAPKIPRTVRANSLPSQQQTAGRFSAVGIFFHVSYIVFPFYNKKLTKVWGGFVIAGLVL